MIIEICLDAFILVELILDHLPDVLYFYWRSVGTRRGLQNIQGSSVIYMYQYSKELGFIWEIDKPTNYFCYTVPIYKRIKCKKNAKSQTLR